MLMAKGCTVLAIDPVPVRAFGLYKSIRVRFLPRVAEGSLCAQTEMMSFSTGL